MSDYQSIKVRSVEGDRIQLHVVEVHPDMTELRRIVDKTGKIRKSLARRTRSFAALLLSEANAQDNSFMQQLQFLVDLGVAPALEEAAHKVISDVEITDLKVLGEGTNGPMHSATVTITARSSLVFRSFRKGKGHGAVATLDDAIEMY